MGTGRLGTNVLALAVLVVAISPVSQDEGAVQGLRIPKIGREGAAAVRVGWNHILRVLHEVDGVREGQALLLGGALVDGDNASQLGNPHLLVRETPPLGNVSSRLRPCDALPHVIGKGLPLGVDLLPEFSRSEEHTSELQSQSTLLFRLLLE